MPVDDSVFAELIIEGQRFDAAGMPASSAGEIQAYREAMLAIAREIWRERNGRRRLPNGFDRGLDLRFKEVEEGSAITELVLHRDPEIADEDFAEWSNIYADARDSLTSAITSIESVLDDTQPLSETAAPTATSPRRQPLPDGLPVAAVPKIRAMGRTLERDDVASFGRSRAHEDNSSSTMELPPRARLTDRVRDAIRNIDLSIESREVSEQGLIIEYDSAKRSFRFRRLDGVVVDCQLVKLQDHLTRSVKEALSPNAIDGPDVLVVGNVQLSPDLTYTKITDVSQVSVVRSIGQKRLISRLIEVGQLENGWLGLESLPPLSEVTRHARDVIMRLGEPLSGLQMAPTSDGSLVFEWRRGDLELTLELQQDNRMLLVIDDTATDELAEDSVDFDLNRAARFLAQGAL